MVLVLAVLIERLGGEVLIRQQDIDSIAYSRLLEGFQGFDLLLKFEPRTANVAS
jgi:hypothetical protein